MLSRRTIQPLIDAALTEDAAYHDITSRAVLPRDARVRARIIAKAPGILAGGPVAAWTFQTFHPSLRCSLKAGDGARLRRGQIILTVQGRARSIFAAERTALNVLGHLSGIATLTHQFVRAVRGTRAHIFDTRKTLPGLRLLEKYAVRVGGGRNHRSDLSEAILVKTNHVEALRSATSGKWQVASGKVIQDAITRARLLRPKEFVEVEVTNLREFNTTLQARPDAILLDNWRLADIGKAVALLHLPLTTYHLPLLEVSGGVTLANVRAIARSGVERISIGRLTHSAPALDVSLEVT